MRHRLVVGFALGLALAACGYERPADVSDDAGHTTDGPATGSDAPLACAPSTTTCTGGTYVECSPEGVATVTLACPLGCDATEPKCRDVDPSNGVAQYLDQARTDSTVVAVTLGAGSTIDTDTGVVFDGATSVAVPSIDIGDYHVFMVKSLSITGATVVSGADGLVIVSDGDVSITGMLDLSANARTSGPGGGAGTCVGGTATSGGGPAGGGGGGGNGDPGGTGGNANGNAAPGGTPGPALTDLDLEPLHGGCAGGDSKRDTTSMCRGVGGGGGGALQIVSRTEIALTGGGVIDASGGGGVAARVGVDTCFSTSLNGGGGGGAGGSVLLEAPQIVLDGAGVVISTKGGGGASGGVSGTIYNGKDGGTDGTPAAGGLNATTGADGGRGGTEALTPGNGTAGDVNEDGGGAGGAVGRVRFNDSAGAVNPLNGATIRSKQSSSVLRTRLVP